MQEMQVQSPGQEDPLEEEMATHLSILTCKIPWTEEPGRLQSMQLQSQTQLSVYTQSFHSYRTRDTRGSELPGGLPRCLGHCFSCWSEV